MTPNRALWPDPISSPAEFDRASRAEILAFAHALAESEKLGDDALKDRLRVDGAMDIASIQRLRRKLWKILVGNYVIASAACTAHETFCPTDSHPNDLRNEAEAFSSAGIEPRYRSWFDDATEFQRSYLGELLRLAAVFPRFNSEVETLNENEFAGWGLPDRHFLLSFDDGPTRGPGYPERKRRGHRPHDRDGPRQSGECGILRDGEDVPGALAGNVRRRDESPLFRLVRWCTWMGAQIPRSMAAMARFDLVHRESHQGDAAGILRSGVSSAIRPASGR